MGYIFAFDGTDGSGKESQAKALEENLRARGFHVRRLSFPMYAKPSSDLAQAYLQGKFGTDPNSVSPYAASTLYAVDRFATLKTDWEKDYSNPNTILIMDRYTGSNAIHQGAKMATLAERRAFFAWLDNFEHDLMGIPRPNVVAYLDVLISTTAQLMQERVNKFTLKSEKDIHERNQSYLQKSRETGLQAVDYFDNWHKITCVTEDGTMRTIEDIATSVLELFDTTYQEGQA